MPKSHTFDSLASTYDEDFTQTPIGRHLRDRVHKRLLTHWKSGDHILEMGCGTGIDAHFLGQQGIRVLATDASEPMLEQAKQKNLNNPNVQVAQLDLAKLPRDWPNNQFDGAFANFGPINCLTTWQPLANWLAQQIKPGGVVNFGVMSPFCLWETIWHSLHLNFKTAFRRLRHRTAFQPEGSPTLNITYPTVKQLSAAFEPHFRRIHLEALGVFLPPSDVYGVIEKRPRLLQQLIWLDDHFGRNRRLSGLADHYWIEFQRSDDTHSSG